MADNESRRRRYRKRRRVALPFNDSDDDISSETSSSTALTIASEVESDNSSGISKSTDPQLNLSDSDTNGLEDENGEEDRNEGLGFDLQNNYNVPEDFHVENIENVGHENNIPEGQGADIPGEDEDQEEQGCDNQIEAEERDNEDQGYQLPEHDGVSESGSEQEHGNSDDEDSDLSEDLSEHSESDGSDENSDEEELYNINDNEPLYNGAQITLKESSLAILSFVLSHKLSGACINDLLSLISLHCGPNNLSLKSLYFFKKYFSMLGSDHIVRKYYCSVCQIPLETKDTMCNTCNGTHPVAYFIECSLMSQLKNMYKRPRFYESLRFKSHRIKKNENNLEDVYDSKIYREQSNNGFLSNPNNISFNMYFDGVSIFKNSQFSLWPCVLSINELSYSQRTKKENILLAGLWFGKSKPNPNLFLSPICERMENFKNEGADFQLPNGQYVRVKGSVISAVADLPAKALFLRMVQFNGLHSCLNCMSSGARVEAGRGSVHVFPYNRLLVPRKKEEMEEFANLAVIARQTDRNASVYGVKGPTLLSSLLPDVVRCLCSDTMHGTFLGLMKTLLDLWFNSENSNLPFCVSDMVDVVDERLMKIRPPHSYQRIPRSIKKERLLLKAADLKIIFFHFSLTLLFGVLPNLYWEHHCKVVAAISLLSQESISPEQINLAEDLLHQYVSEFQQLYGLRYVGLNVHQLLHLCDVVRNLGPSWVYSCFFYESLNGDLASLVHGTRHSALQISASSAVLMKLPVMISEMNECEAKSLCLRYMNHGKRTVMVSEIIHNDICVVGNYVSCDRLPLDIRNLLQEKFNVANGRFQYFHRLKIKASIVCSEMYNRSKRKLPCFVEILTNGMPLLCKVKSFIRWSSCNADCPERCMVCDKKFICIVALYERVPWRLHELGGNIYISHLNKVKQTGCVNAFSVDLIRCVCLYIPVEQEEYMCVPVNSLEIE